MLESLLRSVEFYALMKDIYFSKTWIQRHDRGWMTKWEVKQFWRIGKKETRWERSFKSQFCAMALVVRAGWKGLRMKNT